MSFDASPEARGYVVPRYRADDAAFYHFLHGTVPGHQIDFMYCPEVPQGALRQTHFGHLARLIKCIEPRDSAPFAFAIGNLSRDDVRHRPGHGGVAVLFALRVPGVVDHAGRNMPPYAHGVVAVDRELTYGTLLETVMALHRHFLERESAEDRRGDFYRSYVRVMRETPDEAANFLARAIRDFDGLPSPPKSTLGWDYVAGDGESPDQIALVHDDTLGIGTLAHWASTLAALLYRSNIKWTSLSTGRELDIAGGTTIHFVRRSEARSGLRCRSFELGELPEDEGSLAALLFGAKRRSVAVAAPAKGWREALLGESTEPSDAEIDIPVDVCDADDAAATSAPDVDDAAATIPVGSLVGAAGPPSSPAAPTGTSSAVHTVAPSVPLAANLPAPLAVGGPGLRRHWLMIAAPALATAMVIGVTVTAGLNPEASLPADTGGQVADPPTQAFPPIPSGAPGTSASPARSVAPSPGRPESAGNNAGPRDVGAKSGGNAAIRQPPGAPPIIRSRPKPTVITPPPDVLAPPPEETPTSSAPPPPGPPVF